MRLLPAMCMVCLAACGGSETGSWTFTPAHQGAPEAPVDAEPVIASPPIAIDTHVDTTQRMLDEPADIGERLEDGHLDLPRMREGGLSGAFFSIWVNPREFSGEAAWQRSLALIGAVRAVADRHPEAAALCTSVDDVRRAVAEGKAALLMGLEGAHGLGTSDPDLLLARLHEAFDLGVRYMTITWSVDNPLGHASGTDASSQGLTPLGRRAIAEMNRMGMIVDVSHVSPQTLSDILDVATRPVLASHSSARALSDHHRNLTDAQIARIAEAGGAVCVNYFSQFIDAEYRARRRQIRNQNSARFDAVRAQHEDYLVRAGAELALAREIDPELAVPTLATLGAHFEHVVAVGGAGAACLGSDFDGIPELPEGLDDVTKLPALTAELERRGLDVPSILGENVLRVLAAQTAQ